MSKIPCRHKIKEKGKTRLVEDGNTIYEIDLDCMKRKQMLRQKEAANTKNRQRKTSQKRAK